MSTETIDSIDEEVLEKRDLELEYVVCDNDNGNGKILWEKHYLPYWVTLVYISIVTLEAITRKAILLVKLRRFDGFFGGIFAIDRLKFNSLIFDGYSRVLECLRSGKGSFKALDILYHWKFFDDKYLNLPKAERFITNVAFNVKHCIGVRNRFKLVFSRVVQLVFSGKHRIVSIAAGSGEAVIAAMVEGKKRGIYVSALFIDSDHNAIRHASILAKNYGVFEQITFLNKSIFKSFNDIKIFNPDFIEMTGLIDYFDNDNLMVFLKKIKRFNAEVLTSNIIKRRGLVAWIERIFLAIALDWYMYYRSGNELERIFKSAGFDDVQIIIEPCGMYGVIACGSSIDIIRGK